MGPKSQILQYVPTRLTSSRDTALAYWRASRPTTARCVWLLWRCLFLLAGIPVGHFAPLAPDKFEPEQVLSTSKDLKTSACCAAGKPHPVLVSLSSSLSSCGHCHSGDIAWGGK